MSRIEHDRYFTPQWVVKHCIDTILPVVTKHWPKSILEPGCGDGAFIPQLRKKYPDVYIHANDIINPKEDLHCADIITARNFLTDKIFEKGRFDFIIGNPPFNMAMDFIKKSLSMDAKVVIYLLRQTITGSRERSFFWKENRPSHIFNIPDRISFLNAEKGADSAYHQFFVWTNQRVKHVTEFFFLSHVPVGKRKKV